MSKYPSYEEMKDSGIEWLGEIPEHWDKVKLKYITSCLDNRRIPLNSSERSEMQGEHPYYGANGIVDWVNDFIFDEEIILLGEDGAPFKEFGKEVAFFINEKCWVNNHAHILKSDGVNSIFLTYSLNCVNYNPYLSGSTRYKLTQSDMKKINIAFPPLKEQQAIADFLDRETGKIEELIEKKEKLIELLEEKRQATISQAVTKGLDSDVEMKDSGIEWLGEIPEHWEMTTLRHLTEFIEDGTHGSFTRRDTGIPLLSAKNIKNGFVQLSETESLISKKDYEKITSNSSLQKGDLLLTIVGTIGRVSIFNLDEKVAFQRSVCMIRTNKNLLTKYTFYLIQSSYFQDELLSKAKQSAQSGVYLGDVASSIAIIPSKKEQKEIADHLDQETNRIDSLIAKTEEQIENLKEYKQALISNAVTGKIKISKKIRN